STGNGVLDRLDALGIGVGVLADLDLKRAEAVPEPLFDLLRDLLRCGAVERREQWQLYLTVDPQERMVLASRLAAIIAFACTGSLPTAAAFASTGSFPPAAAAGSRRNSQPPLRVALLEPGEICPSPQPSRPSVSCTSTIIGSNLVKVR